MRYAVTMLLLLAQPDIEHVWYTQDNYQDGYNIRPMAHESVHALIDDFVYAGMNSTH